MYGDDADTKIARDAVANMFVYPITPRMAQIVPEVYLMTESIFRRSKDIPAAYRDCQRAVTEILAE
jgi:hypothetical protein